MDPKIAVDRWVEAWTQGMRRRDPELVAAVYAPEAICRTHPFRDPVNGTEGIREYARKAFSEEETIEVRFGQPLVDGSRAAVEYWALMRTSDGLVTLAGTTVLLFRPDGLCTEHRDYWAIQSGRFEMRAVGKVVSRTPQSGKVFELN